MIVFLLALALGVLVEAGMLWWLDSRAARREAAFWEELKADAQAGYGRVFDWELECKEFGCNDTEHNTEPFRRP